MNTENNKNVRRTGCDDELLDQLLHLKSYETPETARMTRCRQNIMREIRQNGQDQQKGWAAFLEPKLSWFFAEPKYGIALLFVAFIGLQYVSINSRHDALADTGIYTPAQSAPEVAANIAPNAHEVSEEALAVNDQDEESLRYSRYPENPEDFTLLNRPSRSRSRINFVEYLREY